VDEKEKMQAERTVAFLGPPATFSHMACIQHFGDSVRMLPQDTIQDVFDAVETEKADYGVAPVENSTEGPVSLTLDSFIPSEVKIRAEIMTRISHDLLSLSGDAWDMKKIYSHPQALSQCRNWLRTNFPHVPLEETGSTARAAQMAAEDSRTAAIAGSLAASVYGLKVVASRIEDQPNNFTRFLVLGRRRAGRTGKDKTSVLFIVPHAPGTLFRVLQVFYEKGVNLTKIESRPNKEKPWEYIFFLDFEGHATDPHVAQTLHEVQERASFVKLLGSYPQGSQEK
jgi:chorismate mutase/prephenate dehydratase